MNGLGLYQATIEYGTTATDHAAGGERKTLNDVAISGAFLRVILAQYRTCRMSMDVMKKKSETMSRIRGEKESICSMNDDSECKQGHGRRPYQ